MKDVLKDYPVVIEIPVAWGEMDSFNHVNNVVYFRYFESARIAYLDKIDGFEYMRNNGIGPILATTHCRFRVPLTYPDVVSSAVRVTEVGEDRFKMKHIVFSHRHSKVAAEGEGVLVTFDYRSNKKTPVPEELRQRILDTEQTVRAKD